MNKYITYTLICILSLIIGGMLIYYLFPHVTVIEKNNTITVTEYMYKNNSCVDTPTSQYKPSTERKSNLNTIRPINQKDSHGEPNIAYYEYSSKDIRPVGSTYKNKPSTCALLHDRSLC